MWHYILDAFNIIHKSKELKELMDFSPEAGGMGLVKLLDSILNKYPSYKFTVIFDGKWDNVYSRNKNIKIKMSGALPADDLIRELIKIDKRPSNCVVVSSDMEIYNFARLYACTAMKSEDFLFSRPGREAIKTAASLIKGETEKPEFVSKYEIESMKKLFSDDDNSESPQDNTLKPGRSIEMKNALPDDEVSKLREHFLEGNQILNEKKSSKKPDEKKKIPKNRDSIEMFGSLDDDEINKLKDHFGKKRKPPQVKEEEPEKPEEVSKEELEELKRRFGKG